MKKALLIVAAIVAGGLLPQMEAWQHLIRYSLMAMLFFSFLGVRLSASLFEVRHLIILVANMLLGGSVFLLLRPFDLNIAYSAFIVTIAPTGIASIVWADILRSGVTFVTGSIIVTNLAIILIFPWLVEYLLMLEEVGTNSGEVLQSIAFTIAVPLVVAQMAVRITPVRPFLFRLTGLGFVFFLTNVFLATAKVSHYLRYESPLSGLELVKVMGIIAACCWLSFWVGERLAGNKSPVETGLALGRKNTMLSVWLATAYFQPIVILGPMFYILSQNIYNSWQLARLKNN